MKELKGKFKVKKITELDSLETNQEVELSESDLAIQTDKRIIQFEYKKGKRKKSKVIIKPGCYTIKPTNVGCKLFDFELKEYNLLKTIDNTSAIINEAEKFFGRLNVYKELKREPKRALLLHSTPGS